MLLPMIRSFRLEIERLEGVTKLSQKQPLADRLHVIEQLRAQGGGDSMAIAALMAGISTGS